jgi:hypothetical protein
MSTKPNNIPVLSRRDQRDRKCENVRISHYAPEIRSGCPSHTSLAPYTYTVLLGTDPGFIRIVRGCYV